MHTISLFPQLQAIVRDSRHRHSNVVIRYSESAVVMRAATKEPMQQQFALLAGVAALCFISWFTFYSHEYIFGGFGVLMLAWQVYKYYKPNFDIKQLRLQNEVVFYNNLQQVQIEHLHPYYRAQVAESASFAFSEIQDIRVQQQRRRSGDDSHLVGQLFLLLTDETHCFLLEIDDLRVAHNLVHVLQQLVGLPAQPWEEKPWYVV
jgi:hypothetical protein